MGKTKEKIVFYYRGQVERCRGRVGRGFAYRWVDAYSRNGPYGGVSYPWSTYRECQKEAKREGKSAVFVRVVPPPGSVSPLVSTGESTT